MMKAKDLIDMLNRHPEDAPVKFATLGMCSGGFPEWGDCRVREEFGLITLENGDEIDAPTGTILIEVTGEIEN